MVDGSTLGELKAFWRQDIELNAEQDYQFDYWVNANRKVETQLYIDGEKAGGSYSAQAGVGWLQESVDFTSESGGVHTFELKSLGTSEGQNDFGIDGIVLS